MTMHKMVASLLTLVALLLMGAAQAGGQKSRPPVKTTLERQKEKPAPPQEAPPAPTVVAQPAPPSPPPAKKEPVCQWVTRPTTGYIPGAGYRIADTAVQTACAGTVWLGGVSYETSPHTIQGVSMTLVCIQTN